MNAEACCEYALESFSTRFPAPISWMGVEGRSGSRFLKQRRPRREQKRSAPMRAKPARAPITMPAMAPPVSFLVYDELDPVVELLVDVG